MNWFFLSFIAMFLQGVILFLVKVLTGGINPLVILFYQYAGSLLCVAVFVSYKKINFRVERKKLIYILLSGFLVSTGLSFYYLSISLYTISRVSAIHNTGITLFPLLLAIVFLKEKINLRLILGIACSIVCIIFLTI